MIFGPDASGPRLEPDATSREPMKAMFYEGDLWKRELEHVVMPMIERYDVVVVDDPDNSIHW